MDVRMNSLKHAKETFIRLLRGYIGNYDNYSNFCDKDYSQSVRISDREPFELRKFPLVIISAVSGPMETMGLGDFGMDIINLDTQDFVGYRNLGANRLSVNFEIGTRSTLDRDRFTDLLAIAIRNHLKWYLQEKGLYINGTQFGSYSEVPYDSDMIYISNLQCEVWSLWFTDYYYLDDSIKVDLNLSVNPLNDD